MLTVTIEAFSGMVCYGMVCFVVVVNEIFMLLEHFTSDICRSTSLPCVCTQFTPNPHQPVH